MCIPYWRLYTIRKGIVKSQLVTRENAREKSNDVSSLYIDTRHFWSSLLRFFLLKTRTRNKTESNILHAIFYVSTLCQFCELFVKDTRNNILYMCMYICRVYIVKLIFLLTAGFPDYSFLFCFFFVNTLYKQCITRTNIVYNFRV